MIKLLNRGEEALDFCVPCLRLGDIPRLFALSNRQRPIKQVSEVRQNLARSAHAFAGAELGEVRRSISERLASPVGDRGQRMTQKIPLGIGTRNITHAVSPFRGHYAD